MSTTITKSIILQPGEPFTLPPGATLVGSDNPNDLENSCEGVIPTLTYTTVRLFWDIPDVSGSGDVALEATDRNVWIGVKLGGTYYSFANHTPWINSSAVVTQLSLLALTNPFIKNPGGDMFNGNVVDGGRRFTVTVEVLDKYKDDFYAVRYNTVNGDVGSGSGASSSTMYVRFKENDTDAL